MQARITPLDWPAMPPMSVMSAAFSVPIRSPRVSSDRSMSFCSTVVLTLAALVELAMMPWFCPARPPMKWAP